MFSYIELKQISSLNLKADDVNTQKIYFHATKIREIYSGSLSMREIHSLVVAANFRYDEIEITNVSHLQGFSLYIFLSFSITPISPSLLP